MKCAYCELENAPTRIDCSHCRHPLPKEAPTAMPAEPAAPAPAGTGLEVGPSRVESLSKGTRANFFYQEVTRANDVAPPSPVLPALPAPAPLEAVPAAIPVAVPVKTAGTIRLAAPDPPRAPSGHPVPIFVAFVLAVAVGFGAGWAIPIPYGEPETAPAPVSASPAPDPELPGGLVRPGEVYRFALDGGRRADHRILGIVDGPVGTIRASVEVPGEESDAETFDDAPYRKPLVPPSWAPKVGEEVLTVSKQTFACTIYEVDSAGGVRRYWFAPRYPYLVKWTQSGAVQRELTEIVPAP